MSTTASDSQGRVLTLLSRIAAALLGGYAFVWGMSTFGIAGLVALGVDYGEARMLFMLLAFPVYLGVFLWAFAAASGVRVWMVLAGGGALMTGVAWSIQQTIVGMG